MELDVLCAGEVPMPDGYVFRPEGGSMSRLAAFLRPGGEPLRAPLLSFLVRHPSAGPVVVDTGLHAAALRDLRADFGPLASLLFRKLEPAGEPYDEQLRGVGVDPTEVRLAVMTHLHVDHTSGMRLLPSAEFVCSRREWAVATGRSAARLGYAGAHLPPAPRVRLLDLDADGEPYGPFTRTVDLLGDDAIRLISTPGHTPGHLSVLVRLAGGGRVLLVGDAVYTLRSLREEALPLLTAGGERAYMRSVGEIKAFAAAEPGAILVPTHDETAWRAVRERAPAVARA